MKNKLMSIIIPIYNPNISQLNKCFESLINQTYTNLEVIAIDDGSNDEIYKFLEAYKSNTLFKIIHNKNHGVSFSRNCGLDLAQGEYVMFLDSDDYIEKNTCQIISQYFDQGYDYIQFGYSRIYNKNKKEINIYDSDCEFSINHSDNKYNPFDMRNIGMICSKCYSANFLGEHRLNESLTNGEDVEFNFRLFLNLKKAKYIHIFLYNYIQNDMSAVRAPSIKMVENYITTLNAMRITVNKTNRIQYVKAYYSFCAISYLMICLNYVFCNKVSMSMLERFKLHSKVLNKEEYIDMLNNIDMIELPITRKAAIYFAKYNITIAIYLIMIVKSFINERS